MTKELPLVSLLVRLWLLSAKLLWTGYSILNEKGGKAASITKTIRYLEETLFLPTGNEGRTGRVADEASLTEEEEEKRPAATL